ncbi:MAG: electron transport complex subunit RsxC [bacterium (Candidatus Ratteibacteria) CG_4_10_14_3_um_filter_41_18]|uniref:Ion-translocating oxidoreductase complex subunit C n=3 Tax=Candidatus Ratteibacteria TaxID=2979319 RepID=A0A2M7YHJ0_9BACT|nr:MAG: electron transport complex subunit RsxC [bacterium (Candidatus Ratteibacteria) CG01_land_8_20_14_3_00_40_19]PIX77229.1 MAG: electron transport complex subunit RsxC [bacterium (Candidatus Ratteibacteria) CG_4_10_14_3_um_filter_41_18]PJA62444.1 MAG: electron transport complex subunit RsxC [bacterium (Candidatus Ratteibacteria) CG_4_9_14_3_um_filter_41_21]
MAFQRFRGGIYPRGFKYLSKASPIKNLPLPQKVTIPLLQHTGAINYPLVKIGDLVKKGQKIGDNKKFISAPVHSSISGKVIAIKEFFTPLGKKVPSIIIESDNLDEEFLLDKMDWEKESIESIKGRIRESGVVGLGGAAFPTAVKLSPPGEKKIDTAILNGCECEPYLTADYRLMVEKPEEVLEGFQIILKILGVKKGYIGIEDNKPEAIKQLRVQSDKVVARDKVPKQSLFSIKIVVLPTKYPQGAEKQLIKAITHREVPSGGLPMDVGVVVQNVSTALAIKESVVDGKALMERVVTVSGPVVKKPGNFRVRIGTPISELIVASGGLPSDTERIIIGGPMMGIAQWTTEIPVTKGTCGILLLPKEKFFKEEIEPCIRCGKCIEICPMNLLVAEISRYAENKDWKSVKELNVLDCMECSACAYVCPAKRPIVQYIKWAKEQLKVQNQ